MVLRPGEGAGDAPAANELVISSSGTCGVPSELRHCRFFPTLKSPATMKIIFASTHEISPADWIDPLEAALPGSRVVMWQPDLPAQDAEIAVVWGPPAALFERERKLRAVFNLGAGVDALFKLPTLPADLPIVRLEDAGMAVQMAEYAVWAVVRASRQFDDYAR